MSLLFDTNGFYKLDLFLYLSILLLYVVYKKGFKYIILPIIPLLLVPFYQGYIEDELIARNQSSFIDEKFEEVYQLGVLQSTRIEDYTEDDNNYDSWEIKTSNGIYYVHFNEGLDDGFEIYDVKDYSESLVSRQNVIDTMSSLGIEGVLEHIDNSNYQVLSGKEVFIVKVNNIGRVDSVTNQDDILIYSNEEELEPEDGNILKKEDLY